ncbi:MAG TPA: right-handed parallel beta-helix repeat-containing protein, partial [Pyrinomonadaceae bacterium]|nr:right-handed parallel beta-helix repeat-containing protein [Pyrinomonadaceae bacterium]
ALAKTMAGGEIDVLDAGSYGPVTINKAININAGVNGPKTNLAGIRTSTGNAVLVNAGPFDVVVLRGLTLDGANLSGLNGIRFISGGALHVERCTINSFGDKGIDFVPAIGGKLHVKDTIVRNNTGGINGPTMGGGILINSGSGQARASIHRVRVEGNLYGIRAESGALVTISNSVAADNLSAGFVADSGSGPRVEMNIDHGVSANNNFGVMVTGSQAIIRISKVTITNNQHDGLLTTSGGTIISFGNNRVAGNNPDGAPSSNAPQQ